MASVACFRYRQILLVLAAGAAASHTDDLAIVHARVLATFYPTDSGLKSSCKQATQYASTLRPDGSWPDINYNDTSRSTWLVMPHLSRLQTMGLALTANGSAPLLHNASGVKTATLLALDWWSKHNPQNPNWWFNQIGVPMSLGETMLMIQRLCSEQQLSSAIKIIAQAKIGMTGANRVWLARITMWRGLLLQDAGLVTTSFGAIWAEVRVENQTGDNIQLDSSFHQHGPQLLAGSYGSSFSSDLLELASQATATSFAMAAAKVAIFQKLLLDGQRWMIVPFRVPLWDWAVVGREITRGDSHSSAALGGNAPAHLRSLPGSRREELDAFADLLAAGGDGEGGSPSPTRRLLRKWMGDDFEVRAAVTAPPAVAAQGMADSKDMDTSIQATAQRQQHSSRPLLHGYRYFFDSDYASHRRDAHGFMVSPRVIPSFGIDCVDR
jgi:hypothetical protein